MKLIERDKAFRAIFLTALSIVLIGKVSSVFIHFGNDINRILNTFMFCLIGIGYIAEIIDTRRLSLKIFVILCGIYLIAMNFIPLTAIMYWLAGVAILAPLIIFRFSGQKKKEQLKDS